jgi:hypothetical protein
MLVGREPERQRLGVLLQQARSAVSATCVVRGEAGIGKSALLDDVMADAEGWEVLRARGVVTESELSFAVLNDLLRPLRSRFARLPERQRAALDGALGTGPPTGADAFTVAVAVLAVVSGAAEDRPLLVCLDDCQWVDLPSLQCLTFVARRLQADQVLILLTTRTWPTRGPLPSALEGFESLDLGRLPPADAERLLERSAPGLPALERTAVLDRAKGHPLALLELARSPGFLDQSPPLVPASWRLEDVFTDELGRLPTRCREVLERARGRDGDRRAGRLPGHQHDPGGGGARSAVAGPAARHPRAGRSAGPALRPRCAAAHGCAASARPVASIPWAPSSCPWSSHSGCSLTGRSRRL